MNAGQGHELVELFWAAFERFLSDERDNILNGSSEQNLCGRLALAMERCREERGINGYFVDTEYNRKQNGEVKTIIEGGIKVVPIRCDIILHSRGQIAAKDNLIVVEMKRSKHSKAEKQKDRMRLIAMTSKSYDGVWSADGETLPEHVCDYSIGVYLELDTKERKFLVETYAVGKLVETRYADF